MNYVNTHIFAFYYKPNIQFDKFIILKNDPLFFRMQSVLRMKKEDYFICFFDIHSWYVTIVAISKSVIECLIFEHKLIVFPQNKIIAYVPFLEREYMNHVLYALAQQGIDNIRFVKTDYSHIAKYTDKDMLRFEKIMITGCEQAKQFCLPVIAKNMWTIEQMCQEEKSVHIFFEQGNKLSTIVDVQDEQRISFFCGPERGFSQPEIVFLKQQQNIKLVKLTPFVLRSCDVIAFAAVFFRSFEK